MLGPSGRAAVEGKGPCAHKCTRKTRNVSSKKKKKYATCFLPRRLEIDVVNHLLTSMLSVEPSYRWLPRFLSLSQTPPPQSFIWIIVSHSVGPLYESCHKYFTNGAEMFNSQVTSVLSVWSDHKDTYVYQASQAGMGVPMTSDQSMFH